MNKAKARQEIAKVASQLGLSVQFATGNAAADADRISVLDASTKQVLAQGTLKLNNSRMNYLDSDVRETINQMKTRLCSSRRQKVNCSADSAHCMYQNKLKSDAWATSAEYQELRKRLDEEVETQGVPSEELRKAAEEAGFTIEKVSSEGAFPYAVVPMNCSEDTDDLTGDDADFVSSTKSIVTDESGNEIQVNEMLVVQDPETKEISLFVPTEDDDVVPENVEVIGEVTPADDEAVLDSSRRLNSRCR